MIPQTAVRARVAASQVARRGFHSTRSQLASPFHYPEGPRTNLPFNTQTRFFAVRYWTFCGMMCSVLLMGYFTKTVAAVGFGIPFGMAGKFLTFNLTKISANFSNSMANLQELDLIKGGISC